MPTTNNLDIHAADWRKQLQLNRRRTRIVIALFVILYAAIGLLIDVVLNSSATAQAYISPYGDTYALVHQPLGLIIKNLLTLQIIPYATILMSIIAVISLLIAYSLYDKIMLLGTEYHEITPDLAQSLQEKQLYNVIEEMKVAAGLKYMPRVFIIEANYMNAFASGYSEKSAMVAITRGLMQKLDRSEMQAVMAHELSHIRHQDIKLTLTASILSNIMLIAIDVLFYNMVYSRDRKQDNRLLLAIVVLRYILPIITILLTLYLSRTREYMADAGCVELMRDNGPLARALIKIHQDSQEHKEEYQQEYGATAHEDVRRAAYIYDPISMGIEPVKSLSSFFSTHPDFKDRMAALGVKIE
ncbi:zinc metalloprotease HtpX [soil metagenome]